MHEEYPGIKLSIFISKNDKYEGIVLYELLLEIAFNSRLSGGMVTIGDKGFLSAQDESTQLKILRSSENLPVLLEFQGRPNRIERYIERVQPLIKEGLITRSEILITKFSSADEETVSFDEPENENQSQIFTEEKPAVESPDPPPPEFQVDEAEAARPEFDETLEDQIFEGEPPEPEDLIPEEDETEEEELEVFQLTDLSETRPDEDASDTDDPEDVEDIEETEDAEENQETIDEVFEGADQKTETIEMDDAEDTETDASGSDESLEPEEEAFEKLFEESNEKFEDTFDEMLKEVGDNRSDKKSVAENDTTIDEKPVEPEDDSASQSPDDDSKDKDYDKNHTEEAVKNYFSSLFKSD